MIQILIIYEENQLQKKPLLISSSLFLLPYFLILLSYSLSSYHFSKKRRPYHFRRHENTDNIFCMIHWSVSLRENAV